MDKMVVGFAFNKKASSILLVRKDRPEWQKGCLNGIGGKMEKSESAITAINRECKEETGLVLQWTVGGIMKGRGENGHPFECWIFYAYSDDVYGFKQMESEPLGMYNASLIHYEKRITNLDYLIPFGQSEDKVLFLTLEY